jgi:uncharacterized protein YjbI with pentapeptide repeats
MVTAAAMVCRALLVSLALLLSSCFCSAQDTNWRWTDKSGHAHTKADLEEILRKHLDWLDSDGTKGVRADLTGANLKGADLDGVDLTRAILSGANFEEANLKYSTLAGADLRDAVFIKPVPQIASLTSLRKRPGPIPALAIRVISGSHCSSGIGYSQGGANLEGANFVGADLTGAYLRGIRLPFSNLDSARLQRADLAAADLSHASLMSANLREASLRNTTLEFAIVKDADLSDADVLVVDLCGATFEPKTLPSSVADLASIELSQVTYEFNPGALVQLRKQLRDSGFEEREREVTYAIKRREAEILRNACSLQALGSCLEYGFNRVFFDFTCQYGLRPGHALFLCLRLWAACSLLYLMFVIPPGGTSKLYRIYSETIGPKGDPSPPPRVEAIEFHEVAGPTRLSRLRGHLAQYFSLLRTAMFFSLMSAFNIGFREINFGRWLRLLTRTEFDIKAVGWARVIAGWQSLISVLLIALFLLTFFGRPFG